MQHAVIGEIGIDTVSIYLLVNAFYHPGQPFGPSKSLLTLCWDDH